MSDRSQSPSSHRSRRSHCSRRSRRSHHLEEGARSDGEPDLAKQARAKLSPPLSALLVKHKVPTVIASHLSSLSILSVDNFAHIATSHAELDAEVLAPAGVAAADPVNRAALKVSTRAAWAEARHLAATALTAKSSQGKSVTEPDTVDPSKRKALLSTFARRYGVHIEPDEQPSDKLLGRVLKCKLRKVADFISLKDVRSALAEGPTETEQVIPGTRLKLVAADESARKQTDFHLSSLYFLHALRILTHAYALAGCDDEAGKEWVSYPAVLAHYRTVERHLRFESKFGGSARHVVLTAERAVREEWFRFSQQEKLSLDEIILSVADKMQTCWPSTSALKSANRERTDQPRGQKRQGSPPRSSRKRTTPPGGNSLKVYLCRNHQANRCNLGAECPRSHSQAEADAAKAQHRP